MYTPIPCPRPQTASWGRGGCPSDLAVRGSLARTASHGTGPTPFLCYQGRWGWGCKGISHPRAGHFLAPSLPSLPPPDSDLAFSTKGMCCLGCEPENPLPIGVPSGGMFTPLRSEPTCATLTHSCPLDHRNTGGESLQGGGQAGGQSRSLCFQAFQVAGMQGFKRPCCEPGQREGEAGGGEVWVESGQSPRWG